ncbi:MAG: hypothetical protein AAGA90_10345 [Actinomycetota bacterium]
MTPDPLDPSGLVSAEPPSPSGPLLVALAAVGSVAIAVYSLGSARGWWEGSSCALASCGADDIGWAWYTVAAVAAAVSGLLVMSAIQMRSDRRRGSR